MAIDPEVSELVNKACLDMATEGRPIDGPTIQRAETQSLMTLANIGINALIDEACKVPHDARPKYSDSLEG